MLVILTQNWSILTKFAKKIQRNRLFSTDCFLEKFSPKISREIGRFFSEFAPKILQNLTFFQKTPQNWPIFLRILTFLPRNRPIFERILTFFLWKSREIGRFFRKFAPENPTKFCVFFHEISEALSKRVKTAVLLQRPVASALRCLAFTIGQLQNPIFFIKFSLRHPGSQKVSSTVQVYLPTFSEI